MIRLCGNYLRRLAATALGLAGALAAAWLGGFAWFVHQAEQKPPSVVSADGIVVLTGGANRLETGFALLLAGRADRLLISGVDRGVDLSRLAARAGIDPSRLAGRVTLGHLADSTRGNALEIANWVQANGLKSLIVVTSFYHMPRAMAELGRVLHGVALYPTPVVPEALKSGAEMKRLRLLSEEYTKWLAVKAGLSEFLTPKEQSRGRWG